MVIVTTEAVPFPVTAVRPRGILKKSESARTLSSSHSGDSPIRTRRTRRGMRRGDSNRTLSSTQSNDSPRRPRRGMKKCDSNRSLESIESPRSKEDDSSIDASDFALSSPQARRLVRATKRSLLRAAPKLVRQDSTESIRSLDREEVRLGPLLGVGGFGIISAVDSTTSFPSVQEFLDETETTTETNSHTQGSTTTSVNNSTASTTTDGQEEGKLVMKTLKPHEDPVQLLNGCHQMETERQTLAQLNHPHIVRLRGCSNDGLDSIAQTKRLDACFLLLDFLPETLSDRIEKWRPRTELFAKQQKRRMFSSKTALKMDADLFREQLQVAIDIASALQYVHEQRLIHRDLKPDNVGFDENGVLKLFDFGLVAHLPEDCDLDELHDIPGGVGTPRYMATEVAREQPYNHKADVYSFSFVLWEMLTQTKPLSEKGQGPMSAKFGERPAIPKHWPAGLQRIVARGWSEDLTERPCMMEFKYALEDLVRQHCSTSKN